MRIRSIILPLTLFLTPLLLDAQEISIGPDQDKPVEERILYNHQNTLQATIHTQGLGISYRTGKIQSIYKTTNWDFELSYLKPLKQIKLVNSYEFNSIPFVFGKLNEAAVLRADYEVFKRLYGKPYWGGIEIQWFYGGGASLALLKPYYYIVIVAQPTEDGEYQQVIERQTFDQSENWIEIIGKAAFKYGLDEIKIRPGLNARTGLNFEFGSSKTRYQSIEIGSVLEYFPQGIPLMAENPDQHLILSLYLSYSWGSRFNH